MRELMTVSLHCLALSIAVLPSLAFAQDTLATAQTSSPSLPPSAAQTETATSILAVNYRQFLDDVDQAKYAAAAAQFESLVRLQWSSHFLSYARSQYEMNRHRDRIAYALDLACTTDPGNPIILRLLGYISILTSHDTLAVDYFDKAILIDPNSATAFFLRGHCHQTVEKPNVGYAYVYTREQADLVLKDLNEAIRLDPTAPSFFMERADIRRAKVVEPGCFEDLAMAIKLNRDPCEALFQRGRLHVAMQEDQVAIEDFTAAITAYQAHIAHGTRDRYVDYSLLQRTGSILFDCYFERSNAKLRLHDFASAIADLDEARNSNKEFELKFYTHRADIFIGMKDYPAALADLNSAKAILIFSDFEKRAWVKLQLKDYRGTVDDCDKVIGGYNLGSPDARTYRGIAKYHLGDLDGAFADFESTLRWSVSANPDPWIGRGLVNLTTDIDLAIADFGQAIKFHPKCTNAHFQRGLAYHSNKQYASAIYDFNSAIQLEPDNVAAYFNRGLSERADDQLSSALKSFDAAIKLDPKHHRSYYFRGLVKHELGDDIAAIANYDSALAIDPKYVTAYVQRAVSKTQLNDFASALADYDAAIALDPDSLKALTGKSLLLSTCSDVSLRDPIAASNLANRALAIDPKDTSALNSRAAADAATSDR